jgi:hypothetical protein
MRVFQSIYGTTAMVVDTDIRGAVAEFKRLGA